MRTILSLFGRSPFGPLQAHMEKVWECVKRVKPCFDAVLAGDRDGAERITQEICRLESEADRIKDDIRSNLPKSLFLPIDRRDLLEILHLQDSLADLSQDVVVSLGLREANLHQDLREPLDQLLTEVTKVCENASRIIAEIDELVETSFGGHEARKVLEMVESLNAEETVTDELGIAIARKLFTLEKEMSAVDIMMFFRVFRQIGELANIAEQIGNRLRLLIAK